MINKMYGKTTKSDIAREIHEMLGVNSQYTDDLAKANWNGLISTRNGVKKLVVKLQEAEAEMMAAVEDSKIS